MEEEEINERFRQELLNIMAGFTKFMIGCLMVGQTMWLGYTICVYTTNLLPGTGFGNRSGLPLPLLPAVVLFGVGLAYVVAWRLLDKPIRFLLYRLSGLAMGVKENGAHNGE